eukprot:scaffold73189_cov59-Phaeocystis_antarctica.AAC.5
MGWERRVEPVWGVGGAFSGRRGERGVSVLRGGWRVAYAAARGALSTSDSYLRCVISGTCGGRRGSAQCAQCRVRAWVLYLVGIPLQYRDFTLSSNFIKSAK